MLTNIKAILGRSSTNKISPDQDDIDEPIHYFLVKSKVHAELIEMQVRVTGSKQISDVRMILETALSGYNLEVFHKAHGGQTVFQLTYPFKSSNVTVADWVGGLRRELGRRFSHWTNARFRYNSNLVHDAVVHANPLRIDDGSGFESPTDWC